LLGVLLAVTFVGHILIYFAPGDPAYLILVRQFGGRVPSPEEVARLQAEMGWDQPPAVQYVIWLGHIVQGDLGYSVRTGEPIIEEILPRIGRSLLLAGVTAAISLLVGIPVGFLAAWRENSFWDHATRTIALLGVSIPSFWLAFILILVFAIYLNWLPTSGMGSVRHLVLPVVCLGVVDTARLSRLARSGFLEVQHEDYLLAARTKGLTRRSAWLRHGLPNIAVPLITLVNIQFSFIVAGAVIVETIFAWPGIGQYYIASVQHRDIPTMQALVLFFGLIFSLFNFLTDIVYMLIDPRFRLR
jgi:ABC-type dipeptide/oligopeptide/nickel transport system permease component